MTLGGVKEIWSGGVNPWECDVNAHLNVRHHVAKSMEALASLAAELGLPHAFSRGSPTTLRVKEQYIRFLKEAHAGASLYGVGGVIAAGETEARLMLVSHHLSGEPAAAMQVVVEHVAAEEDRPIPWPAVFHQRAEAWRVDVPPHAAARTLTLEPFRTTASRERAEALDLQRIALTALLERDCDHHGRFRPEGFIGRIGDGMPRLLKREPPRPEDRREGGAVLEYRLVHLRTPRLGDRIEIRAGVAEIGARLRRVVHWMLDPDGDAPWGVATSIAVGLDLQARKMLVLSPEEVEARQAEVIHGLAL
jgi:acyl-CoA thioester hydrolase